MAEARGCWPARAHLQRTRLGTRRRAWESERPQWSGVGSCSAAGQPPLPGTQDRSVLRPRQGGREVRSAWSARPRQGLATMASPYGIEVEDDSGRAADGELRRLQRFWLHVVALAVHDQDADWIGGGGGGRPLIPPGPRGR